MQFEQEIHDAAVCRSLDPMLVGGLIAVESTFNAYAWNPEPNYRYFWNVHTNKPFRVVTNPEIASAFSPKDFPSLAGDPDQEWWAQQSSWGLMQVMGALARELGFAGPYLPELTSPEKNLAIGCVQLRRLLDWANGDTERALAAYNGGKVGNLSRPLRNQAYASNVLAHREALIQLA